MKRLRLLVLGLLAGALLTAGTAQAKVLHLGGHFLGITPHGGVSAPAGRGRMAHMATSATASSGQLTWQGGPVVHSSAPYLIFWTPQGESLPSGTPSLLTRYFTDVAAASGSAANVYGVARQYYDATGVADYRQTFSAASQVITDTNPYPSGGSNCAQTSGGYGTCLTDAELESEIQRVVTANHLPSDGSTTATSLPANAPIYFVVLPADVNLCSTWGGQTACADRDFCAYHSAFTAGTTNLLYAAIPTLILGSGQNPKECQWDGNQAIQEPNRSAADVVVKYVSHEDNESLTDPFGSAWYDMSSGNENGDLCNAYGPQDLVNGYSPNAFAPALGGGASGTLYDQLINANQYYLQSEWSNGDNGCDLRPPASTVTPAFSVPASPATGAAVSFDPSTSTSTAAVTSATWTFGDGATAFDSGTQALASASHTYAAGGTYAATLTLVDALGNSATTTQQVTVAGPTSSFSTSAESQHTTATEKVPMSFDASASTDIPASGSITSYTWNFGDRQTETDTAATTTHTYAHYGTYQVKLTVTDRAGLTSSVTRQLAVADESPTVSITAPAGSPGTGVATSFAASAGDPDGSINGYSWNFGDGTTGSGATPSHVYTAPGTYTVTVTVTDSDGVTAQAGQTVAVAGPAAAFTAPAPALEGTTFSFAAGDPGSASAGALTYDWSFGDGSAHGTGPTPTHVYATAGSYTVILTETDANGDTTTATHTLTVLDEAPTAAFSITSALASTRGAPATFSAAASADPDGTVSAYSWQFGDGTAGSGVAPVHQYTAPGVYPVTLTVTDSGGQTSAPVTQTVTVYAPPTAAFTIAGNGATEHQTMSFDASTSSQAGPGGPITSYQWSFGDGTTAPGQSAPHGFAGPGTYPVTLTVANAVGLTSAVTQWVTVGDEAPSARLALRTAHPTVGHPVSFDGTGSTDPDGHIVAYDWTFGDGASAATSRPQHTYRSAGRYTVTVTVTGSGGERATATTTVTVAPVARVTAAHVATGPRPTLVISVSGPGTLRIANRRVTLRSAGHARAILALTGGQRRTLGAHRVLHLVVNLTFTPLVGAVQHQRVLISVRPGSVRSRRYTVALRP